MKNTEGFNEIIKKTLTLYDKFYDGEFVYHYTNLASLISIIDHKELWLSERNCMNDKKDESFVRDFCFKLQGNHKNSDPWKYIKNTHQYILSTSMEKDSIHQWSYYGSGDGVCIEFRREPLINLFGDFFEWASYYYGPILYTKEFENDSKEKEIISDIYKEYNNLKISNENEEQKFEYEIVEEYLYSLVKQYGHHCEQEYRFTITEDAIDCSLDELKKEIKLLEKETNTSNPKIEKINLMIEKLTPSFRTKNGLVIPYIKFPFEPKDLISSIILSPGNHEENARDNLRFYLKSRGLGKISVKKSIMSIR